MGEPAHKHDGGDYDERVEVYGGELVPKETARYQHSNAQRGTTVAVGGPFHRRPGPGGPGGWWIVTEAVVAYPDGWTFLHDLAGWKRDRLSQQPAGRPVRDTPDWVCEILSSNRKHDTVTKFEVLGQAGVRHYWLIDVDARELVVHRLESSGWVRVSAFVATGPGQWARIEPFDAIELELAVLFGDDPED